MATLTSRISTTTLSSFATDLEIPTYLRSNGHFPGKRWLASSPWLSYLPPCHGTESLGINGTGFLQTRCASCRPTNNVKALKETHTNSNQWPGLVLSSSTTGLRLEMALLSLCWLCYSIITSSHHIEMTDAGLDGLCIREISVYHTNL